MAEEPDGADVVQTSGTQEMIDAGMFEESAEVMGALAQTFDDYQRKREPAVQTAKTARRNLS